VQGIAGVPEVDGTGERLALNQRGEILPGVRDERRDLTDFTVHDAAGVFDILLVQPMEVRSGSAGAILASYIGVLQGAELLVAWYFHGHELLGELEHIENELLNLDSVRFVGGQPLAGIVDEGNLLFCHVQLQLLLERAADLLQEA